MALQCTAILNKSLVYFFEELIDSIQSNKNGIIFPIFKPHYKNIGLRSKSNIRCMLTFGEGSVSTVKHSGAKFCKVLINPTKTKARMIERKIYFFQPDSFQLPLNWTLSLDL